MSGNGDRGGPHARSWDWEEWVSGAGVSLANAPGLRRLVARSIHEVSYPNSVVAPMMKLVVPPQSPEDAHRNLVTLSLPPRVVHNIRYGDPEKNLNLYALVEVQRHHARALEAGIALL